MDESGNKPLISASSNGRNGKVKNSRVHRTSSLESGCDVRMAPISNIQNNSDVDTEEEEENNNYVLTGNERHNSGIRSKRSHQRYASRSLPVTPRVNSNCPMIQGSPLNPVMSSPHFNGFGCSSTPLLMAPHLATHLSFDGSFNSISSLSPNSSQYVTCTSGFMSETQDKVLPGSIDYSSLPLPKDDAFRSSIKRNISRHMSEPSIHEIPNIHLSNIGKCNSCPQRKNHSKNRRRTDSEMSSTSLHNSFLNCGGNDSKTDEVEGVEMQWQFIKTLVDELNAARSHNNRISVELHQAKLEIQMLKATLDSYSEAGTQPGLVAEMVRQIHAAQKLRDEAMMSRIKLANEERDAAMTQTRSLLEKLGLSPRAPLENLSVFNLRDHSIFSTPFNRNEECINISPLEEELKALKLAFNIQDSFPDKCSMKDANNSTAKGQAQDVNMYEELKTKLNDRVQLQDRCSKLERVFSGLRRKLNGLHSGDVINASATSLPFIENLAMFGSPELERNSDVIIASQKTKRSSSSSSSSQVSQNDSCPKLERLDKATEPYSNAGTSSEGELKDSSLESVETSSSSSWKPAKVQQLSHQYDSSSSHSTMGSHSTLTPPSPHSPRVDFSTGSKCEGKLPCQLDNSNDRDRQASLNFIEISSHHVTNDCKSRNYSGVSIMGPITEL